MDTPTTLVDALDTLRSSLVQGPEPILQATRTMVLALTQAVSSCRGIRMLLVEQGQPIIFTATCSGQNVSDVVTSLEFPLVLEGVSPEATVWVYAARAGAWVDLAADLAHALGGSRTRILLDTDIPRTLRSEVEGLKDLSLVNYAVGVLIDGGHRAETALDVLTSEARARRVSTSDYAVEVLNAVHLRHQDRPLTATQPASVRTAGGAAPGGRPADSGQVRRPGSSEPRGG